MLPLCHAAPPPPSNDENENQSIVVLEKQRAVFDDSENGIVKQVNKEHSELGGPRWLITLGNIDNFFL